MDQIRYLAPLLQPVVVEAVAILQFLARETAALAAAQAKMEHLEMAIRQAPRHHKAIMAAEMEDGLIITRVVVAVEHLRLVRLLQTALQMGVMAARAQPHRFREAALLMPEAVAAAYL